MELVLSFHLCLCSGVEFILPVWREGLFQPGHLISCREVFVVFSDVGGAVVRPKGQGSGLLGTRLLLLLEFP